MTYERFMEKLAYTLSRMNKPFVRWGSEMKTIKNPNLPREGENVVKPAIPYDFMVYAFQFAWAQVNLKAGDILKPRNIYIGFEPDEKYKPIFETVSGGIWVIDNPEDVDEWWMDFEDSDLIFYSPGA